MTGRTGPRERARTRQCTRLQKAVGRGYLCGRGRDHDAAGVVDVQPEIAGADHLQLGEIPGTFSVAVADRGHDLDALTLERLPAKRVDADVAPGSIAGLP